MVAIHRKAYALLCGIVLSGGAAAAAHSVSIDCNGTPFGRRLNLGLDQEYLLVHADTGLGTQNLVWFPDGVDYGLAGVNNQPATLMTPASVVSTRIDLDGDGQDEWAIAGIKPSNAHIVVVTTFRRDVNGNFFITQGPVYEFNIGASNVITVKIAAAIVTDRNADTREELVVALGDSLGALHVLLLDAAAGSPEIQQASNTTLASWTMPGGDPAALSKLQLATGDVLLDGRDQVVLMAISSDLSQRVYYVLRYDALANPRLSHYRYTETRLQTAAAGFDLHIADFGGTPAAELLVHDQTKPDGVPSTIRQEAKYFTTVRDINNVLTAPPTFHSALGFNSITNTDRAVFAVATGELDRRPGAEFALARQRQSTLANPHNLLIELYRMNFDANGHASAVVPYLAPNAPFTPIAIDEVMFASTINLIGLTIGDPDMDGIGEVAVAVKDQVSSGDSTPQVKMRSYAMARPQPNANPDPTSFAFTGSADLPTVTSANLSLHLDSLDFDGDSVLADIGTNCQRIAEPMLRSVVHLPPYWTLLQGDSANFLATIGKTKTLTTEDTQSYGTFTSHDISGYIGVSIGADAIGTGAKISAKITAGYNYEARHGETYGTDHTTTVGQSQQQFGGEGLVVKEENTFDCYTYDVHTLGITDPESSVRSCALIDRDGQNNLLRSFTASDLVVWDTVDAYNQGLGLPAQWTRLAPDWASVALFHVPTANFAPVAGALVDATDGSFASTVQSPSMIQPYLEIDLGGVQPLTNVSIFPAAGRAADLDGLYLYTSANPFSGPAPPSGPGVAVFAPDPASRNGFDHWQVWLRNPVNQTPRQARYLRLQAPALTPGFLSIAEIQAFAEVHIEPPAYPEAVCDTVRGDGIFTALMYDARTQAYRKVDVRGQMLWSGAPTDNRCGVDFADSDIAHKDGVQHFPIWDNVLINSTGLNEWDLSQSSGVTVGDNKEISHSARVGVELDAEAGAFVKATIGGAYEFSTGVTESNSTSMYWGDSLEYAGKAAGFSAASLPPRLPVTDVCAYRPHPFAYIAHDYSNNGFEQQYTAVDYVVRDLTSPRWSRAGPNYPPTNCYAVPPDRVFAGSFEP